MKCENAEMLQRQMSICFTSWSHSAMEGACFVYQHLWMVGSNGAEKDTAVAKGGSLVARCWRMASAVSFPIQRGVYNDGALDQDG